MADLTVSATIDSLMGSADAPAARTVLGLGNVDNTSDANKPVSTATATALAGKAATVHGHTASEITDASANGRSILTATDYAAISALLDGSQLARVNNADYTVASGIRRVSVRSLTQDRTIPLPAASGSGAEILIGNEDGSCMPFARIIVAPNGADTIEGRNAAIHLWGPWQTVSLIDVASGVWVAWVDPAMGLPQPTVRRDVMIWEDDMFTSSAGANSYISSSTSTGSISSNAPGATADSVAKGAMSFIPGTASGHYAGIRGPSAGNAFAFRQWNRIVVEFLWRVVTVPDATNDARMTFGITSSITTSDIADGAVFQIERATDATNLLSVTAASSSRTKQSAGQAFGGLAVVGTWHRGCIDLTPGTDAKFYHNGTLVNTINTNVPGSSSTGSATIVATAQWVAGAMAGGSFAVDRIRAIYLPNPTYVRPN